MSDTIFIIRETQEQMFVVSIDEHAYGYSIDLKTGKVSDRVPEMPILRTLAVKQMKATEYLNSIAGIKGSEDLQKQVNKQMVSSAKEFMNELSKIKSH